MPGNPFKKAAPRPNLRAIAKLPKVGRKAKGNVPVPKQPISPSKSVAAPKMGAIKLTSKARKGKGAARPKQGPVPGSKPGTPGSAPGAKPW